MYVNASKLWALEISVCYLHYYIHMTDFEYELSIFLTLRVSQWCMVHMCDEYDVVKDRFDKMSVFVIKLKEERSRRRKNYVLDIRRITQNFYFYFTQETFLYLIWTCCF